MAISRQVVVRGDRADDVARKLLAALVAPDLVLAFVFHDWRLDPHVLAKALHHGAGRAIIVGSTTTGAIGPGPGSASAIGFYGAWLRAGVGVAAELSKSPLNRSRDAVHAAADMLGVAAEALEPSRHVGIAVFDGTCGHEEAFCVGSAAAAPQVRFVGGAAGAEPDSGQRAFVWTRGEALADAGVVVLLESGLPFHALRSSHLTPTELRTVVTAASGRQIDELDGRPAAPRLHELVAQLGDTLATRPAHTFARFVDGIPYVRSILSYDDTRILLRTAVEPGHVLRIMRPGDLVGATKRDLALAADKVGGNVGALIAFSCIARHWDAAARGLTDELTASYAQYPTVGAESFGEQSGMLLVNHTLTGLAIGAPA